MLIESEKILEAKEKLGDENAFIMAEALGLDDFDERNLKACCPYHEEDTPSFIYDKKRMRFHCFSCQKTVDILDVFMEKGMTYIEACEKLFEAAKIPYSFGEKGVRTKAQYRYPKQEQAIIKDQVEHYLGLRGISSEIITQLDIRQDNHGNCVFNYYDTNDVLTMVKYRPSHAIDKTKGEIKNWAQKDADTAPLLYNMNKINVAMPLLITEGEIDCAAAIECGYHNTVSVPFGAGNYTWIEHNWDWLEQFESIIIASDNDEAGQKMRKEVVYRLGSWRCKVVEIPTFYEKEDGKRIQVSDINEMMYWFGKDEVLKAIINAKDQPVASVVDFSDVSEVDLSEIDGIYTGIQEFDQEMMRLFYGTFNIVTGVNGCVDCETEFHNGKEWKRIADYEPGEMVLQYNPDGTTSYVEPLQYHKYPCDHFWEFKSCYGVNQMVSDEHNLVYLTSKNNIQKKNALEWIKIHDRNKNGFAGKFITTFKYDGKGIPLTDEEIRVMCAVIADGSFQYPNNRCRINIKKNRKQMRLRKLLNDAHISYEIHQYNPRDLEFETFLFNAPLRTKVFDSYWYQCNEKQMKIIADEVIYWDGTQRNGKISFSTTDKLSADFVQFAFSASGYRSKVSISDRRDQLHKRIEYTVSRTKSIHPTLVNVQHKIEIAPRAAVDGYKYCFTVPSSMLVLRRGGDINITGNSGKSSWLSQLICQSVDQGKDVWLYSRELPNYMSKNWINYIFAGNRHIKKYVDDRNSVYYKVTPEARQVIDEYYKNHIYIYRDDYENTVEAVKKSMEDSVRKYGSKLLILDNLTAINMNCTDNEKWSKQVDLVNWCIDFAKKFHVVVILVIHPKKIETMRRLTKFDVQGLGSIVDLAHRLISLYRVTPKDKAGERRRDGRGWFREPIKYDVMCDILKDRMRGRENLSIGLYYDPSSRRFFTNEEEYAHQYKWDNIKYTTPLPKPKQLYEPEEEVFGHIGRE